MLPESKKPKSLNKLIEAEPPENPTWFGFLPKNGTALVGGGAKIGKSFIMLELALAACVRNTPFGHHAIAECVECPKVHLFEQELGPWGLKLRSERLFKYLPPEVLTNLTYTSKIPDFALDTEEGFLFLRDLLKETQADILYLDPVGRMLEGDDSSNQTVRTFYSNLDRALATRENCSAIVNHHFRKPGIDESNKNTDTLDMHNFRGASQWVGNPDAIISASRRHRASKHSWYLEMRVETRQGNSPDDFFLEVNPYNTARVVMVRNTYKTPFYGAVNGPFTL